MLCTENQSDENWVDKGNSFTVLVEYIRRFEGRQKTSFNRVDQFENRISGFLS